MRLFRVFAVLAVSGIALLPGAFAQAPGGDTWIQAEYTFAFQDLSQLDVTGELDLKRIALDRRYDADELRDAYRVLKTTRGDAAAADFVTAVEDLLADQFQANLELAFPGSTITAPVARLDEASLEPASGGDPNGPPVVVTMTSHVEVTSASIGVEGVDADDLDALLDAGAALDIPLDFFADPGHDNTFVVDFPPGLIAALDGAPVGGAILVDVANLFGSETLTQRTTVQVSSVEADAGDETVGSIDVVVDIVDLDVTIAGAAGGDFGNMVIDITGTAAIDNVVLPESATKAFPEGVHFSAISATGMRRLVAAGLVDPEDLDAAGEGFVKTLRDRLRSGLGAEPTGVEGGFDVSSLQGDSEAPMVFSVHATVTRPLSGGAQRSAALALYTVTQSLPFQRIEGLDTTYHVILPKGLAATGATTNGGDVATTTRADGRDEVTLALAGDDAPESATMQVQIAVTPTFVLAKFWPIVLVAALVVVAIVGAATWGVVKAVRGK